MNDKELFENKCLPLFWLEDEEHFQTVQNVQPLQTRKDLNTLEEELEGIKDTIEELTAREWHLDRLLGYHSQGFTH